MFFCKLLFFITNNFKEVKQDKKTGKIYKSNN